MTASSPGPFQPAGHLKCLLTIRAIGGLCRDIYEGPIGHCGGFPASAYTVNACAKQYLDSSSYIVVVSIVMIVGIAAIYY